MQDITYNKKLMGNMFKIQQGTLTCGTEYAGRRCFSNTDTNNYCHSALFFGNAMWVQRPSNRAGVRLIPKLADDSNRYKLTYKPTEPRVKSRKDPVYYNLNL